MTQLGLGLGLAAAVAWIAYRAGSLSQGGAWAALVPGTLVFGLGGWTWTVPLLGFFVSSSLLSQAFVSRKRKMNAQYSKTGRRDASQVAANGALAAAFVVLHALQPAASWPWIGYAAALASVNADTWATELGVLNLNRPRLITAISRSVEPGTSGAISLFGTGAALLGAALIALLAAVWLPGGFAWTFFWVVAVSGLLGSLFDSLLGATCQAIYFCPLDQAETEQHPLHTCGTATVYARGWKWLNNDWVNFACSAAGAALALGLSLA